MIERVSDIPLPGHHVGCGPHRAGDEPGLALGRVDRPLAGQPHVPGPPARPGLPVAHQVAAHLLGVVVVALDRLLRQHVPAHETGQALRRPCHHLLAVQQREVLRPAQIPQVGPELGGAFDQVGQVRVG